MIINNNNKKMINNNNNNNNSNTKIYKTINELNPTFMNEIFSINTSPYDLRHSQLKNTELNYEIYGFYLIHSHIDAP